MNLETAQLRLALFVSLGTTVAILAVSLVLAMKHRARAHMVGIAAFLVSFLVTLYFAETLGQRYDFPTAPYAIHLSLAVFTTLFTLAPIASGVQHWRGKVERKTHQLLARVWGCALALALVTGAWMLSVGTPKAAPPAETTPQTSPAGAR